MQSAHSREKTLVFQREGEYAVAQATMPLNVGYELEGAQRTGHRQQIIKIFPFCVRCVGIETSSFGQGSRTSAAIVSACMALNRNDGIGGLAGYCQAKSLEHPRYVA
ncbi:unnamed protein product [Ostreobium quekettii]|uniref:Uncharacterized protein n=1 Tax=Ostreobium quekettii TaxID=121088 RepID=A0A8S1J310_9CHLO|nr:unnamed protein product [Ostreobium quekettii]